MSRTSSAIPVAPRVSGFVYAIRNIVAEARKVEASGRKVRYLNIGDSVIFGFHTPPHMIEAVERAMREGHNGYAPSVGILAAREAVTAECIQRGMPMSPDRVVVTSGTSSCGSTGIALRPRFFGVNPASRCRRHVTTCEEYSPSFRRSAPSSPWRV